jgi:hypothetical protein
MTISETTSLLGAQQTHHQGFVSSFITELARTAKKVALVVSVIFLGLITLGLGPFFLWDKIKSNFRQIRNEASNISAVHESDDEWEDVEANSGESEAPTLIQDAKTQLKTEGCLKSRGVMGYASYLQSKNPSFSCFMSLIPDGAKDLSPILEALKLDVDEKKNGIMYIPFILNSKFRDHIVVLTVNLDAQTMEYYDSKGKDIFKENRIIAGLEKSKTTPKAFAEALATQILGEVVDIRSNIIQHQTDHTSCGVFVCRFMERRQTETFEKICQNPTTDIKADRKQMAENLKATSSF